MRSEEMVILHSKNEVNDFFKRETDLAKNAVDDFLKKRKGGKTRKYVSEIMSLLFSKKTEDSDLPCPEDEIGWLQPSIILSSLRESNSNSVITNSTFYRLLVDLEKNRFIERRGKPMKPHRPGRVPVYYRIATFGYSSFLFWSKDDLQEEYLNKWEENIDLKQCLVAAKEIIKKNHAGDHEYNVDMEIETERKKIFSS
jgi:DNA-binding PadR family transcriptional regulator